jgi:hypothetical protein
MVSVLNIPSSIACARQSTNTIPNDGNGIRQDCRCKSHQRQAVRLAAASVSTFASSVTAHESTNATLYVYSLLISAKAWSRTVSRTVTGLGCTDASDNVDSIFVVPTGVKRMRPQRRDCYQSINQSINQRNKQWNYQPRRSLNSHQVA